MRQYTLTLLSNRLERSYYKLINKGTIWLFARILQCENDRTITRFYFLRGANPTKAALCNKPMPQHCILPTHLYIFITLVIYVCIITLYGVITKHYLSHEIISYSVGLEKVVGILALCDIILVFQWESKALST